MSYTALYRKFRPDTFEDVKGQDHIVTTFKKSDSCGSYRSRILFCGTRGTGKTNRGKDPCKKRSTVSNRWTAVHVTSARPVGRYRREHP